MPQVSPGWGGNGAVFCRNCYGAMRQDIFSSGSIVEDVTFQGKGGFKKSYHTPNTGHSKKRTAAEENTDKEANDNHSS